MKKNSSERIRIRRKGKYLKSVLKVFVFIIIAVISGAVSSKIVISNILKDGLNYDSKESNYNINEDFTKGITDVSHSIVTISGSRDKLIVNTKAEGNVTGVVVDKQGYIVTSLSKIKNMKDIFVKLPSLAKDPVEGILIGADENTDVALIKVNSDGLIPVVINEEDIKEGNIVMAAGNSISNDYIGMVTVGIVTSVNGRIYDEASNNLYKVIQTSATINDENIGGPLCNVDGELVGFNSDSLNIDKDNSQLYYSLSAVGLKKIIDYIISFTDKLGISGELIDDKESGLRGLYIENITANGYAAKAGLLPTDIIMSVDNKKITSLEDINEIIKNKKSGESIQCEVLRDGVKTGMEISFN